MTRASGPTVVLADDSALLREGLAGALRRFGFDVVADVPDAAQLLAAVDAHEPELVVTDVRMPPGFRDEGLRAAIELRSRDPALPLVVLSQYVEQTYAAELLADGETSLGYLLKDRVADVRALVAVLRDVLAGATVIDPDVVRVLLTHRRDPIERLTPRERETLALMAEGHSNGAIARALVTTEATAAKHIRSIFDKLELPPNAEHHRRVLAVVTYLQAGDAGG